MKLVILVKAKKMPVGTIRKYGQSFYKKTANKGWQRVPTKDGRKLYEKQESKKTKFIPNNQNLIFAFEDLKPPLPLSNLGARKYLIEKGYVKKIKNGFERTNKGTEKYLELKRGKKERRAKQLAEEYRNQEEAINKVIQKQTTTIKLKERLKTSSPKFKRIIRQMGEEALRTGKKDKNLLIASVGKALEGFRDKKDVQDYIKGMGKDVSIYMMAGYEVDREVLKDVLDLIKINPKLSPFNKKVETPTKQPTRTKKTPTRKNVSNVTQQYIDKLKKIKIMNESGKRVYVKLVKRAIKNKDRKLLDQYLKEIDNWIKRDKKLKEGKKKKMDWGAVR